VIEMPNKHDSLDIDKELIRKIIHFSASVIALLYYRFDKSTMLVITFVLAGGFLFADLLRMFQVRIEKYFHIIFSPLLRTREKYKDLTGATYLFVAVFFTVLLFDRNSAIASILILTVSDTLAALIGKKYGRNKIGFKSVEGSITFFIATCVIIRLVVKPEDIFILLFISGLVTFVEAAPIYINDNLSIPLISGLLLTVFQ